MVTEANNVTCTECEGIVSAIDNGLKTYNSTIVAIEDIIKVLCQLIGGSSIEKECDAVLNVFQSIVNMLLSGYSPEQVCDDLGFCSSN